MGKKIKTNLIRYDSITLYMEAQSKDKNKVCLVAGGAGFIGSHLCKSLLSDGYRVICVDNFLTGSKDNVENLLENDRFTLINADVTKKLPEVVIDGKVDFIFHLASPASPNGASPRSYLNLPLETMDANSIDRNAASTGWKQDFHKVASIPPLVVEMWYNELKAAGYANPNPMAKENNVWLMAKLNSNDFLKLRTKEGNI